MEPLLELHTVPLSMDVQIQNARLEINSEQPTQQVTRVDGSFTISHSYPKIHIDTSAARSSMGFKTALEASKEAAADSMQAAMESTARIAEEGDMLMQIQDGITIADVAKNRVMQRYKENSAFNIGVIPSVPADISWDPPALSMQYEADKLIFDWNTQSRPDYEFIPADIQFKVLQYSHLEIEYIGDPVYVPPSANPNYEPPVLNVSA